MRKLKEFDIEIARIRPGNQQFDYKVDSFFFKEFEYGLIENGNLDVEVDIEKTTHLMKFHFKIEGVIELVCDRSLEKFDYPLSIKNDLVVKFGQEEDMLADDVVIIKYEEQVFNIADFIYEFITVAVPLKRLHPKFVDEDNENEEEGFIYTSGDENEDREISPDDIDPRWKELLKLKNKGK